MPNRGSEGTIPPTNAKAASQTASDVNALPPGAKRKYEPTPPQQNGSEHTPKPRRRRRRRAAGRRAALKLDRWLLKGVSQMKLFTNWIRDLEDIPPLLYCERTPRIGSVVKKPRVETAVERAEPSPLRYRDPRLVIVLTTAPLPDKLTATQRAQFSSAATADVASHEFSGYLLFINFYVAKRLVATRKTVRPALSQGPWPATDLLINPAATQRLQVERYTELCSEILTKIQRICRETSEHPVIVYVRLGLDLCPGERSLLVCAMENTPDDARDTSRKIWRRLLKQPFDDELH